MIELLVSYSINFFLGESGRSGYSPPLVRRQLSNPFATVIVYLMESLAGNEYLMLHRKLYFDMEKLQLFFRGAGGGG